MHSAIPPCPYSHTHRQVGGIPDSSAAPPAQPPRFIEGQYHTSHAGRNQTQETAISVQNCTRNAVSCI
eukprot:1976405-Rhodomonas_salina.1